MSLNPLQALQEQQRSAENLFIASGSTGLVCLATGAVSAFLVKTNRLSCANFRRLTGVVGAVFLAALYCGRKAFQQMTEIQKTRSETAEKQRLFDRAFPAASKHISKMFSAMEKPLFEGSTDAVTLKTITDALTENRNLAQALNAFSALDTSNGLKAFFLEHAIKGRDLSSEQRMLVLNFFKDLCSNNRYSMLQLMRAWPGDVPKALQTSPAAIGIIKGQPWLCEGGAFDLIAGLFTKQGEELYTFLGSNVSTEGWDAFLHPTSADPISVLGAQAHRAEQHFRATFRTASPLPLGPCWWLPGRG